MHVNDSLQKFSIDTCSMSQDFTIPKSLGPSNKGKVNATATAVLNQLTDSGEEKAIDCETTIIVLNTLNSFSDCLEFYLDFNLLIIDILMPEVMTYRRSQNQPCVPKKASPLTEIEQDLIARDRNKGPSIRELTDGCNDISSIRELLVDAGDLDADGTALKISNFIQACGEDARLFLWFKTYSAKILGAEKPFLDAENSSFATLPTVHSSVQLENAGFEQLQRNLKEALFNPKFLNAIKEKHLADFSGSVAKNSLRDCEYQFNSENIEHIESSLTELMNTKGGMIFLYYLYHSISLHLIVSSEAIGELNEVKKIYFEQIGDPQKREEWLHNLVNYHKADALLLQEGIDLPQSIREKFLDIGEQHSKDGTLVLLDKHIWSHVQTIRLTQEDVEPFISSKDDNDADKKKYIKKVVEDGVLNIVIAQREGTDQLYCFASAHANSSYPQNGLDLIAIIYSVWEKAKLDFQQNIELAIGIDANTKKEKEVNSLLNDVRTKGLEITNVGITTRKERAVAVQINKIGDQILAPNDYLIHSPGLKKLGQGKEFKSFTAGSGQEDNIGNQPSPENPSDHLPIWVKLASQKNLILNSTSI